MFNLAAHAKSRNIRRSSTALISLGLIALAGCGSSSSSSSTSTPEETTSAPAASTPTTSSTATTAPESSSTGSALKLEANSEGQLKYDTTSLSATAGKVSIAFTNAAPIDHNVTIESASGQKVGETPTFAGGSKTLTATLKPGVYKFYCSVPGHRQGGMEGTLTVK